MSNRSLPSRFFTPKYSCFLSSEVSVNDEVANLKKLLAAETAACQEAKRMAATQYQKAKAKDLEYRYLDEEKQNLKQELDHVSGKKSAYKEKLKASEALVEQKDQQIRRLEQQLLQMKMAYLNRFQQGPPRQ